MAFKLLTLLQLVQILSLYLFVTVCLPAWVFHKKLSGFSLSARLMFYYVIGNFFVINLVFLLQLLHISNPVTLMLGTAATAGFFGIKNNALMPGAVLRQLWRNVELVLRGAMGYRTLFLKMRRDIRKKAGRAFSAVQKFARGRIFDILLAVGVTAIFFARFGANLLNTYSYCASDMIVHNYWINALGEGKLFVAGVYPQGFHCLMYYMHEMFGIDNYVLLRIFWIVQTLMVFYGVLVFLKGCCKNRYLPYLGVAVYIFATLGGLGDGTYWRFFSSLPQTFGMVFILPSVQLLFLFFEKKKAELDRGEAAGKESWWCLAGFAMSFALTISIHFYNAMIIGLFCLGGIVGYGFRLFRKEYFLRVIAAGLIGVLVAAFPMIWAVLTGTPLEGSLHWGLSIIQNSADSEETEAVSPGEEETAQAQSTSVRPEPNINEAVEQELKSYVIRQEYHDFVKYIIFAFYVLPLAGALFWILGHRDYGARMMTIGCSLWLLGIMIAAGILGLPALMDEMRASFYVAFVLIVGMGLLADALLYGLTFWTRREAIRNIAVLSALALIVGTAFASGIMKDIHTVGGFGMNEAVVCLTNIIHENKDLTWTILSANDELRMADDHGYHYELSDFLREMEHGKDSAPVTIPTQYVYIFIEKIPQSYVSGYNGSGQSVSEEGAARALPAGSGLGAYQLENRWIIMSRMYYWAKEFQKLYPNELKVYYETDQFVCYCLEQNTYSLYNLAIDYGYNMR